MITSQHKFEIHEEINDKMVKHSQRKSSAVGIMAEAAQHYVPTQKDNISINADCFPNSEIGQMYNSVTSRILARSKAF